MLELHIDSDVSSGYLKVSWCLNQEVLTELAKRGLKNPNLILVIADPPIPRTTEHSSREEDIFLNQTSETIHCVPLKDLVAYIPLYQVGQKQIVGFIDTCYDSNLKLIKELMGHGFLRKGANFNSCRDGLLGRNIYTKTELTSQPVMFDIPQGIFASKISEAEKKWLEFMLPVNFKNECELRKYRLFGYTIQIPFYLLWLVVRLLIVLAGLLYGAREMKVQHFFSPANSTLDFFQGIFPGKGSIFVLNTESKIKKYLCLALMPLILIPAIGLLCVLIHLIKILLMLSIFDLLKIVGIFVLMALAMVSFVHLLTKWHLKQSSKTTEKPWYLDDEYKKILICDGSTKKIPAKYKSLQLRFTEMKTKICKPFSM